MRTAQRNPGARMPAETDTLLAAADRWLAQFERALGAPDDAPLRVLFHPDSHWRDVLALTWDIRTVSGRDAIVDALKAHAGRAKPTGFRIDPDRTAPRHVTRAGTKAIEAIFRFETAEGRGSGVLRLIPDAGDGDAPRAWTLLTALDELKGFEEQVGRSRPRGESYSRDFRGPELARPPEIRRRVRRPRSGGAGGRRRPGRAFDRRAPDAAAGRHADRRSRAARRRQLAQALPRADAAQPGARQPSAVHAVPAELADVHPQGQARRLVRGLRGEHGAQLLDRPPSSRAARTTNAKGDGRSCCAGRTARSARCTRGTS